MQQITGREIYTQEYIDINHFNARRGLLLKMVNFEIPMQMMCHAIHGKRNTTCQKNSSIIYDKARDI